MEKPDTTSVDIRVKALDIINVIAADNNLMGETYTDWFKQVWIFHKFYKQKINSIPTHLDDDTLALREKLIKEEYGEFMDAVIRYRNRNKQQGFIEMCDALGDMMVVILGTFVSMGVDPYKVMWEICLSNMSKADEDGSPKMREDGKVLKGPYFFKPDLEGAIGKIQDN